jgi:hypothetical protein
VEDRSINLGDVEEHAVCCVQAQMEISPGEDISDAREGFGDGCQKGFVVQDGLGRVAMVND